MASRASLMAGICALRELWVGRVVASSRHVCGALRGAGECNSPLRRRGRLRHHSRKVCFAIGGASRIAVQPLSSPGSQEMAPLRTNGVCASRPIFCARSYRLRSENIQPSAAIDIPSGVGLTPARFLFRSTTFPRRCTRTWGMLISTGQTS